MNSRSEQRTRLVQFVSISLLAHLQIVLLIVAVMSFNPQACDRGEDWPLAPVEIALVTPEQQVKPRELAKKLKEELEEEKREERDERGQVVELPRPREERRPDKAKYLSEYDSSVTRETKARKPSRIGKSAAKVAPPAPQRAEQRAEPRPKRQAAKQPPVKLAMRQRIEVPRSRLGPSPLGRDPQVMPRRQTPPRAKSEETSEQQAGVPQRELRLRLSDTELAEALGGVNDALQDVDDGKATLLNSKRWRYASFFNRVKRQVAQNWRPGQAYRRRDPTGNVYGFKDRLTILRVKLRPSGGLESLHLEKPSGLAFLDDVAMTAFRLAEPFPNPPRGLVDQKTGMISFRFGFLFEISRRPSFQILRQAN